MAKTVKNYSESKNEFLAYQKYWEELLGKEMIKKLVGESILSIKSKTDKGDTEIIIETKNYFLILGANDLRAWFEELKRKKIKQLMASEALKNFKKGKEEYRKEKLRPTSSLEKLL